MSDELTFADLGVGGEDFIAKQVVAGRRKLGKRAPKREPLARAITSVDYQDTMQGSSTLTIVCSDPQSDYVMELVDFFDIDEDGQLDPIDLNWPEDTDLWWRLTQLELGDDNGPMELTFTFMERKAVLLMRHHGPEKATRGAVTRAEFINHAAQKVHEYGGITFHSHELHQKQPVAGVKLPKTDTSRKAKAGGFDGGETLSIKHQKATRGQLRLLDAALSEAEPMNPPDNAVLALVCAAIGESTVSDVVNSKGYGGMLQGQVAVPGGSNYFAGMSATTRAAEETKSFMQGGRGYQGGGAIALAKQGKTPGEIATTVEVSGEAPNFYGQWLPEAKAIVNAWGGGFGALSVTYKKKYHFTIGTQDNPHENYWDAFNRLADDVRWRLFIDGDDLYFDNDMTLIRQKPIAVIQRKDPSVVRFQATWDTRNIATQATLELVCDPTEFRAGEVFKLEGFGMASRGSTAKPPRPGYWLISQSSWNNSSFVTTFTLTQPQKPKKEPAPQIATKTIDQGIAGSGGQNAFMQWARSKVGVVEGSATQARWANDLGYSPALPWCSIFIAYGIKHHTTLPLPASPAYSGSWLSWKGGSKVNLSDVQIGDLVIFDWGDGGRTDHVGVYDGSDYYISGNFGNKVSRAKLDRGHVVGVVRPHYV